MKAKIALIVVMAPGGVIGSDNKMPWYIPRDLRYFRRITSGHPVIMGRKTFESLKCKALPNRRNIVLTRDPEYTAPGCEVVHSLKEAIDKTDNVNRVFIIGGGQIYATAILLADEIYLTQIENKNPTRDLFGLFNGDTYFPEINKLKWKECHRGRPFIAASKMLRPKPKTHIGLYFRHIKYIRIPKNSRNSE